MSALNQSSGADHAIAAIRNLTERIGSVSDLTTLRGFEGDGAARYFAGLRFGLDDNFGFTRRLRRPPTDPVMPSSPSSKQGLALIPYDFVVL